MIALRDIHQCCAKGFYEIRTTYWFPFYLSIPLLCLLWELVVISFCCVLQAKVSLALLLWWVCRSRVSLVLLSKFLLDFDSITIGESK